MNISGSHILLVDDHPMIIVGLQKILSDYFGATNISIAKTGEKALEILKSDRVDLVITDWDMPSVTGYDIAAYSKSKKIKTIVLTSHTDIIYLLEMESLNVNGILLKKMDDDEIVETILEILNGKTFIHPEVKKILDNINNLPELSFKLTKREKQTLNFLKVEESQQSIADKMFIELVTVEKHLASIRRKLGVKTNIQALEKAFKLGLIRR